MFLKMVERAKSLYGSDIDFRAFVLGLVTNPLGNVRWHSKPRKQLPAYFSEFTLPPAKTGRPVLPLGGFVADGAEFPDRIDLRLAGETLPGSSLGSLPWNREFADDEDLAALHRFAWALPLIARYCHGSGRLPCFQAVMAAIFDWIDRHPDVEPCREPWHPYTVSERIVNWLYVLAAADEPPPSSDRIAESILRQAQYLAGNLEYFGESYTGNHLSNNGRALYLAGLFLRDASLFSRGKSILLQERGRIFAEPGFLREGSAHYQFLVTRNYCEALFFARYFQDASMATELEPTVSALAKGCRFFMVAAGGGEFVLPLIGDLSPDCPPEWLSGVPWVCDLLTAAPAADPPVPFGWHFFFANARSVGVMSPPTTAVPVVASREWGRLDSCAWSVFGHVNPAGVPITAGHAHQDTGSVAIFWNGNPLVIDCGRKRYSQDAVGSKGKEYHAHSMAVLDECNPAPFFRGIYSDSFLARRAGRVPVIQIGADSLEVVHGGFARLKGGGMHSRTVCCFPGRVELLDRFEGRGRHRVTLILHFPCQVVAGGGKVSVVTPFKPSGFSLTLPEGLAELQLHRGGSEEGRYGWASSAYGAASEITSVVAQGMVELPWSGKTILEG